MRKFIFVAFLSLFWLSACSSQQKNTSVIEAIKSEGINITQFDSPRKLNSMTLNPLVINSITMKSLGSMTLVRKKSENLEIIFLMNINSFLVPIHHSFISQAII
ncbi:hypothetical protein SAMN05443246_1134 [Paenibacillus sp. GP183]|nr:hypothetical protein SAMN05443246_1134 [Paenibacillus sp. GP183]